MGWTGCFLPQGSLQRLARATQEKHPWTQTRIPLFWS